MPAVPIYVWNGSAWQETGPTIPANPIKYQASAPSSPSTGDIWVDSDGDVTTGSQQFQRFRFVAVGGETTISGADANGAVLAYTAGLEQVVLNGAVLVRGYDYLATTGTTITGLSPALVASDVLEVFSFIAFTVANTYTQAQVDGLLDSYVGLRLITPTSVVGGTIGASGAVTFSGASSVSLNGCFTSTYDNYKVLLSITSASTDVSLNTRFRTSGTDNSGATYNYYNRNSTTSSGADTNTFARTQTSAVLNGVTTQAQNLVFDIFAPALSVITTITLFSTISVGNMNVSTVCFNNTTSFDGFSFYPNTGTITGTIRVYGYKN